MRAKTIAIGLAVAGALAVGGGVIASSTGGANPAKPPPTGPPPWVDPVTHTVNTALVPGHADRLPPPYQGPHRPPGVVDGQGS